MTRFIRRTFCYNILTASKFSYCYNYSLDNWNRCRWSSNPDEPLLYVKYDWRLLNILDVEKQVLILKSQVDIEPQSYSKYN